MTRGPYKRERASAAQLHSILEGHVKLSACVVRVPELSFDPKKSRNIYVRKFDDTEGYVALRNGNIYRIILDEQTSIWNAEPEPVVRGDSQEATR